MNIAVIYGTRPEIIKLVPLIMKLRQQPSVKLTLINTGQHREMVSEVEKLFHLKADFSLNVMQHDQSLTTILLNVAEKIEPVLKSLKPKVVLLQGDTTTVATVGTVCFYNKIPVGHVEAGLRSYNLAEPFPEEFNRRTISIMAEFNFAPTKLSADNLIKEGIHKDKVFITGNTIVDMVQLVRRKVKSQGLAKRKKILITAHRRENHGGGLLNICSAVARVIERFPEIEFKWPVHPNPNVKETVYAELGKSKNVFLVPPLDYFSLVKELEESYLVWSDSGGIQEECPSFKKPLLILRNVTERPEVVSSGFGILVGTNADAIVENTTRLLNSKKAYFDMIQGQNPFGDGKASDAIVEILMKKLTR